MTQPSTYSRRFADIRSILLRSTRGRMKKFTFSLDPFCLPLSGHFSLFNLVVEVVSLLIHSFVNFLKHSLAPLLLSILLSVTFPFTNHAFGAICSCPRSGPHRLGYCSDLQRLQSHGEEYFHGSTPKNTLTNCFQARVPRTKPSLPQPTLSTSPRAPTMTAGNPLAPETSNTPRKVPSLPSTKRAMLLLSRPTGTYSSVVLRSI